MVAAPQEALHAALKESFCELCKWAFGPQGIPSLQVIAFGDFSRGLAGDALENIFVCRNESDAGDGHDYQVFDPRDKEHEHEWAAFVLPFKGFLGACPVRY